MTLEEEFTMLETAPVYNGEALELECVISGVRIPSITWHKPDFFLLHQGASVRDDQTIYTVLDVDVIEGSFSYGQREAEKSVLEIRMRSADEVTCEELTAVSGNYSCEAGPYVGTTHYIDVQCKHVYSLL